MDLHELAQQYFGMQKTFQTAPGETYGPAMSRRTRTPIMFTDRLGPDSNGLFLTNPKFQMHAPYGKIRDNPLIKINPLSDEITSKATTIPNVIRHEDTHALLENTLRGSIGPNGDTRTAMRILQSENPYYSDIESRLRGQREGFLEDEVPAYATQPDYQQFGIPPPIRNGYVGSLIKSLESIDPKAAKIYRSLAGVK